MFEFWLRLRSGAIVVSQKPTESLAALNDRAILTVGFKIDEFVTEALMVALFVIMTTVLAKSSLKRAATE